MEIINKDQNSSFSDSIVDYEFRKEIGIGSFGRVYEAFCSKNGLLCAIKVIDISKTNFDNLNRINTEITIHLSLKHENIVKLYNVLKDDEHIYLILELCWGSLKDYLQTIADYNSYRFQNSKNQSKNKDNICKDFNTLARNCQIKITKHNLEERSSKNDAPKSVLPFESIRNILKQITNGLLYLHNKSIIHRDLNLKNILLKDNPYEKKIFIKIADFGLAFDANKTNDNKNFILKFPKGDTICGTPGYISPEVWCQNGEVAQASDVFALGSILYALITGVTPKGELDISEINPLAADLIMKLLENEPLRRIDLHRFLSHAFMKGYLCTKRLSTISKLSKSVQFQIDDKGSIRLEFLKLSTAIEINGRDDKINIHTKSGKILSFKLETLPFSHWKKFLYAWRFVELIKSKTPKVTLNFGKTREGFRDQNGIDYTLVKCSLMENKIFEVHLVKNIDKTRTILSSQSKKLDEIKIVNTFSSFRQKCIEIEMSMVEIKLDMDPFPINLGKKMRIDETSEITKKSEISALIDGIGSVSLLTNGAFRVDFNDGSSIITGDKSPVIYRSTIGHTENYNPKDSLPKYVLKKLSLVPKAIQELRKQSSISERGF